MNILSIQSHVAYGHVGNSSATFTLQRLGAEVWPIHTVQFSNHTGYGDWRGSVFDGTMICDIMEGIEARGVLPLCNAVLSGYMGSADIGKAILSAIETVRAANSSVLYACDPVIGDVGRGIFVREGVAEFIREQAVPMAQIITPNQFELDYLAGRVTSNMIEARAALNQLHRKGPQVILVTSFLGDDTPADCVDLLASTTDGIWRVRTPRLDIHVNGAGDVIAALFVFHYLKTHSMAEALSKSASSIFSLLKRTADARSRELLLIEAQNELVHPTHVFLAERI